jgi:hypothetical protein
MATAQAALTPTTNTAPAVISIPGDELSGGQWVSRFPGSAQVSDCNEPFRASLTLFLRALEDAGATVSISSTLRPRQRAYLMHWSWSIVKQGTSPESVPSMAGVSIRWAHPNLDDSKNAAGEMVDGYGIRGLGVAPALNSKHVAGLAVDMAVSWAGTLTIADSEGRAVAITSEPRSGLNTDLHAIGAGYGVIKYNRSGVDRPHWSDAGN